MSQRTMEAHYRPNRALTQAVGLAAYNCGYAESAGRDSFFEHQKSLVWRLLGDTPIDRDATVVDVGCGIGGPIGWIAGRFHPRRAVGLEYLWSSVRSAGAESEMNGTDPRFVQGDAHTLPLADESVDVVFNLESALHYRDKRQFLSECHRVLKPGGTLCLGDITTNDKSAFAPIRWLNGLSSQFNCNVYLWSGRDYTDAFEAMGFEQQRHEEASAPIAAALRDGRLEIRRIGWLRSRGFRGRRLLLGLIESQLRAGRLTYDLFQVRKPGPNTEEHNG